jgi:hypothetical protein
MAILAIQLTLADYAAWKSIFDTRKQFRKDKMGVKFEHLYRSTNNPNEILLWLDVLDAAKTRSEIASDDVQKTIREADVVGQPSIHAIS